MKKFYLITNTSNKTYWSYKVGVGDIDELPPLLAQAVGLYGVIYVNRNGGWMPQDCVSVVHETVESEDFPPISKQSLDN